MLGMESENYIVMHILAITETPDRPTVETFIGIHKQNIRITVICKKGWKYEAKLKEEGINTLNLLFLRTIHFPTIKKLKEILLKNHIDIVHTYTSNGLSNTIFALMGFRNIKLVAYRGIVGNVSFLDPISWMRYLNPRIDRIICVCNAIRDHFLAMKPRFLVMPNDRPVTIYKGHRIDWYQDDPADIESLGIPKNAFVVGCVANSRPRKGLEYLIGALDLVPKEIPLYLLLVGRMKGRGINSAVKLSKNKQKIIMPGFCENAPAISAACDAVCLPSYKREGLPRSIIEAMSSGVPPIVTNSGGSPELVEHEVSGIVVPAKDSQAIANAIEKLYESDSYRNLLGKNAIRRIEKAFTNEVTIEKTIDVYHQLLN